MQSIEQIEGAWETPDDKSSGLVLRCHAARKKPIDQLSDLELATLLNQNIGVEYILPEAVRRVAQNQADDTEHFEGQLKEAVERTTQRKGSAKLRGIMTEMTPEKMERSGRHGVGCWEARLFKSVGLLRDGDDAAPMELGKCFCCGFYNDVAPNGARGKNGDDVTLLQ